MALKYLARNSPLYKNSQDGGTTDKLIYGEEVETLGPKENGRTNGKTLYAARRVASSYMWEYYVIDNPAVRSK